MLIRLGSPPDFGILFEITLQERLNLSGDLTATTVFLKQTVVKSLVVLSGAKWLQTKALPSSYSVACEAARKNSWR